MGKQDYNSAKRNTRFVVGEPDVTWTDISGVPVELANVSTEIVDLHTTVDSKQPLSTVLTNTTASFTTALESKLNGVAANATQNASDASLRDRSTHTGTQVASTISDFTEASQDVVGAMVITAGGTYDDAAGTITLPSGGGGSDPWTWTKLASNNTVSTTAFASVSGMSFTATANTTYLVELIGAYQTAATTTGIGLALDIPSGSVIGINIVTPTATTVGGAEQIADATTTGATTGVRTANTNTPITARWVVAVGATGGTVQLMQRSEVATSNTVLQANLTILGRRTI